MGNQLQDALNSAITTKTALRIAFLLVAGILISGQLLVSLWIFSIMGSNLPNGGESITQLYFQLVLAPTAVIFLMALGVYLFIVNRYLLRPLDKVRELSTVYYLERKPLLNITKTSNAECNLLVGTLNGVLETLQYADNLATKSQLIADNLYETVEGYKKVFGDQNLTEYQQEILKYTPEQRIHIVNHLAMAMSLESMQVFFLPQVDRESDQIVAMDALVRWEDSLLGSMDPVIFLAIAEECGLIVKLTDITLHHACSAIKSWQQHSLNKIVVSINLSRKQFYDTQLISRIMNACRRAGITADHFEFEISEPILHENLPDAYNAAQGLSQIGSIVTVDHYKGDLLTQYDMNRLKIRKIKMDHIYTDKDRLQDSSEFVEKLLEFADEMGIQVVAGGIESYRQNELWRGFEGPLLLQGFFYGEPVDQVTATALLKKGDISRLVETIDSSAVS